MSDSQKKEKLKIPSLPLAVYREIAAHLRQLDGIEVDLIPQSSQTFSYFQSQVEGLILYYSPELTVQEQQRCQQILNYYQQRHGHWKRED